MTSLPADGKADPQHRFAGAGVDADRAAVPLDDDAPGDVQPEAGALADVLGREEGLERTGRHLRRHPPAGVGDLDDDEAFLGPGRQPQRARARPSRRRRYR